jgi:hypothetical protein
MEAIVPAALDESQADGKAAPPARAESLPAQTATPAVAPADAVAVATPPPPVVEPPPVTPAAPAPAPATPAAERAPTYVYALGQIDVRLPSLGIEKELAQVLGRLEGSGQTSRQMLKQAVSDEGNRYLARSVCWIFTIEGLETYIVVPRDPHDLQLLIDAYREQPSGDDLDVLIGVRSGVAPPEMCNGLALPVVVLDQLYSFDRDGLIESIPRSDSLSKKDRDRFPVVARELFDGLIQLADNAGAIDEHRALNYLTVRYPRIYEAATERLGRNLAFTSVDVVRSPLSGVRSIVDVVFTYTHRETDVAERDFVRVDVTEEFPFLVTKLSPYYAAGTPGSVA